MPQSDSPEPRIIYQVYCPMCSMSLIYSRARLVYNHPAGEVYCPNQHKDFSVEQPTVREVK